MKYLVYSLTVLGLLVSVNSKAETILRCAVKKVPSDGARINLIKNSGGDLRANLIFGTTISGTMYKVREVRAGVYQGEIGGKSKFWIKLSVSSATAENRYIRGFRSALEVVYPDLREKSGFSYFKSSMNDEFVCGEQIGNYSK